MRLILALLVGLMIHLVTALVNDVADIQTDADNAARGQFSGGSGVIVEGVLSRSDLMQAAGGAAVLSLILTAALVFVFGVHWGLFCFLAWGL